jgi:hypothetical protein
MRVNVNGSGGQFQSFAFANFTITVAYQKKTGIDCSFYNFMRDTVREINQIDLICLNNYGQTTPVMGMPIDRRG